MPEIRSLLKSGAAPTILQAVEDAQDAKTAAEAAADRAEDWATNAEAARDAALLSRGVFASTGLGLSNGVAAVTVTGAGSGGANGAFALTFSGGAGTGAAGTFTVASGAVVSVTITHPGTGYTSAPTVSFAASAGLTGVTATVAIAPRNPVGTYFSTPGSGDDSLILWRVDAGPVAAEVTRYPSTQRINSVLPIYGEIEPAETVPLFTDDTLRAPMNYNPATGVVGIELAQIGSLTTAGITSYQNDPDFSDALVLWADEDDRVLFALTADGAVGVGSAGTSGALRAVLGPSDPDLRWSQGIAHIITNGQSLSTARGVLYPVQSAEDYTFSGGVDFRVEDTGSTLIPMFNEGVAGIGWDAVQQSKAMMLDGDPLYVRWPMLLSSHGFGGQFITTLSKGGSTGSYEDMMWGVTEGKRLADAAGTSYAVRALIWAQGESERNQTQAYYQTNFGAYLADLRADVAAITAQDAPIHILTHQPSGNQYESSPGSRYENTVALATSAMHEADPLIIPACPMYWVPHFDDLHPTAEGTALVGAMMGKVLYHVAFRGEPWRPLYPRKIRFATPRICIVQFDVPVAPIVLDTDWVSDPGDFGFVIEDAGGVKGITSVRVIGADTVEITLAANIGASPVVSYAAYAVGGTGGGPITGARGCLRDSDPALSIQGDHLWNPCLAFKKSAPWERT